MSIRPDISSPAIQAKVEKLNARFLEKEIALEKWALSVYDTIASSWRTTGPELTDEERETRIPALVLETLINLKGIDYLSRLMKPRPSTVYSPYLADMQEQPQIPSRVSSMDDFKDWFLRNLLAGRARFWRAMMYETLAESMTPTEPTKHSDRDAELAELEHEPEKSCLDVALERRLAVDAYIEEVFQQTGWTITRTDFWKAAGYKTRAPFECWERNDPKRQSAAADIAFSRILRDRPHLEVLKRLK